MVILDSSQNLLLNNDEKISGSENSDLLLSNDNSVWADANLSKGEKIWAFAKKIGVILKSNDDEQMVVDKIKAMEVRDKEAKRKMVTKL